MESSSSGTLTDVAIKTSEGNIVVIVANKGDIVQSFNVSVEGKVIQLTLKNVAVATYIG